MVPVEVANYHHKVLQLQPSDVCYHQEFGIGSDFCCVYACTNFTNNSVVYLSC